MIERNSPPDILLHGLVTPADLDKLFDMCVTSIFFLIHQHEADVKRQILEPDQCM